MGTQLYMPKGKMGAYTNKKLFLPTILRAILLRLQIKEIYKVIRVTVIGLDKIDFYY